MKRLNDLFRLLGMAAVAYAVYLELRKPPEERTWNGKIGEFVPYEFRIPTVSRVMSRVWNPDDERILMPTIFGVGWTVNWAAVLGLLQRVSGQETEYETA